MNLSRTTLSIYLRHAKRYKKKMLVIYPLMTIAQFLEDFLSPLIISGVLTAIAANDLGYLQDDRIWLLFLAIALLELIPHLLWNVVIRNFWRAKEDIMRDLNMTAFNHLQLMSFRFFSDRFAGSIVNQVNKFAGSFDRLTDALTWNVYKLFVSLVLTTVIIAPRAPLIAVAILAIAAVYAPIVWLFRRRQIPLTKVWAAAETKRTGQLADTVSNILAVKSFSSEPSEQLRMQDRVDDVYGRSMTTMKMNMRQELVTGFIQRSINVTVIILSVWLAVRGYIEVGIIYLALTYTMALMRRLWDLNNTFRTLTRVFGDAYDMTEILQIEPEVADPVEPAELDIKDASISFKNVGFRYQDKRSEEELFSSLNIEIKPGEKIGLVGPSGGGKTTITKLLMRFMDIQNGSIEIGGQDISTVSQSDLRSLISYVPQEPLLFHRSIHENICYGKSDATEEEILTASKQAHAHEFVEQLQDEYETLVGERGVKLSGGQKQRIAIARSAIKDTPILVLDEATSALDSESEQLIQDALWKLMKGKTTLVIAHRLSTIQRMDRILVMDKGKIVEQGSHDELVKKKRGVYAKLWSHQSGGFIA